MCLCVLRVCAFVRLCVCACVFVCVCVGVYVCFCVSMFVCLCVSLDMAKILQHLGEMIIILLQVFDENPRSHQSARITDVKFDGESRYFI